VAYERKHLESLDVPSVDVDEPAWQPGVRFEDGENAARMDDRESMALDESAEFPWPIVSRLDEPISHALGKPRHEGHRKVEPQTISQAEPMPFEWKESVRTHDRERSSAAKDAPGLRYCVVFVFNMLQDFVHEDTVERLIWKRQLLTPGADELEFLPPQKQASCRTNAIFLDVNSDRARRAMGHESRRVPPIGATTVEPFAADADATPYLREAIREVSWGSG
jgi:hypothetical protein